MRGFGFTGGRGSYTPNVPPGDPYDVIHAWVGAVSTTGATVKFRSTNASAATLLVSTSPMLTSPDEFVATEGADDVWTAVAIGLDPATQYYYGFVEASLTGRFRTFPSGAANFSIAAASCGTSNEYDGASATTNSPAFDHIVTRDPALFIHLGDRHYRNISSNNVTSFRTAYNDVIANARQKAMHLAMPVAYMHDDHDYGGNDSNGSDPAKPAAHQVYGEHVPHWTLPVAGTLAQSFVIGRVRVIILDPRSSRSAHGATDNSSKSLLGTDQKTWFKAELLAATEPCILVCTGSPWIGTNGITWGIYSTERAELAEFFEDNNLTDRLILLAGDQHFAAGDDGTNSQYDSGSANPGPVVLCYSPLDQTFTSNNGTWSAGIHKGSEQQYGSIDFVDDGDDITATFRAWEVNDGSESQLFSFSRGF